MGCPTSRVFREVGRRPESIPPCVKVIISLTYEKRFELYFSINGRGTRLSNALYTYPLEMGATRQLTNIYTVITDAAGKLVTAFPVRP